LQYKMFLKIAKQRFYCPLLNVTKWILGPIPTKCE